jgi:hypothetical protein
MKHAVHILPSPTVLWKVCEQPSNKQTKLILMEADMYLI